MGRTLVGKVTSDRGDKTIVITITERRTHPLYKKQYSVNTKFMAHDEKNEAKIGDIVSVSETRPLSARKRFTLAKILERGGIRFEETDATADIPVEEKPEETKPVAKKAKEETAK
jgi:small subunit ribosomal protein S17